MREMKYETILFDWDGTLANTMPLWISGLDEALRLHGIVLTREELVESCRGFDTYIEHRTHLTQQQGQQILHDVGQRISTQVEDIVLYDGAHEMLCTLKKRGVTLGLITSSGSSPVHKAITHHGLEGVFDAIISGDDVTQYKPHTEPFEKIADVIPVKKAKTVMVGDRDVDIMGAHNYGIDSVLFYPDEHKELYDLATLERRQPTYTVRRIQDVISI